MISRSPTRLRLWTAVFLLFIFIQMVICLMSFAGEFIRTEKVRVSPFHLCLAYNNKTLNGSWWNRPFIGECVVQNSILASVVTLSLYIPVVLVAFALLAVVFAVFAEDEAVMWLSMLCQGASSGLLLVGIIGLLFLYGPYMTWNGLTPWFYACVGVQLELALTTVLSHRSMRRVAPSDRSEWI